MFRGVQYINMDAKGRMAVPAKYRDALISSGNSMLVATIDTQSPCLSIHPLDAWEEFEKKLHSSKMNKAASSIKRMILGHASELELDANGRVRIPAPLQKHASLEKKLVLVGYGPKFELWSEDAWEAECETAIASANSDDLELPEDFENLILS